MGNITQKMPDEMPDKDATREDLAAELISAILLPDKIFQDGETFQLIDNVACEITKKIYKFKFTKHYNPSLIQEAIDTFVVSIISEKVFVLEDKLRVINYLIDAKLLNVSKFINLGDLGLIPFSSLIMYFFPESFDKDLKIQDTIDKNLVIQLLKLSVEKKFEQKGFVTRSDEGVLQLSEKFIAKSPADIVETIFGGFFADSDSAGSNYDVVAYFLNHEIVSDSICTPDIRAFLASDDPTYAGQSLQEYLNSLPKAQYLIDLERHVMAKEAAEPAEGQTEEDVVAASDAQMSTLGDIADNEDGAPS